MLYIKRTSILKCTPFCFHKMTTHSLFLSLYKPDIFYVYILNTLSKTKNSPLWHTLSRNCAHFAEKWYFYHLNDDRLCTQKTKANSQQTIPTKGLSCVEQLRLIILFQFHKAQDKYNWNEQVSLEKTSKRYIGWVEC